MKVPHRSRVFKARVLVTRDASFQHCFETWQLIKFFYIYCYLARTIQLVGLFSFYVNVSLCNWKLVSCIHITYWTLQAQKARLNGKRGLPFLMRCVLQRCFSCGTRLMTCPTNEKNIPLILFLTPSAVQTPKVGLLGLEGSNVLYFSIWVTYFSNTTNVLFSLY